MTSMASVTAPTFKTRSTRAFVALPRVTGCETDFTNPESSALTV